MLPLGGDTIEAPPSVDVCAPAREVKNAQPTTRLSRDRRIQVFTTHFDADSRPGVVSILQSERPKHANDGKQIISRSI
jgi:hypothetical protein